VFAGEDAAREFTEKPPRQKNGKERANKRRFLKKLGGEKMIEEKKKAE